MKNIVIIGSGISAISAAKELVRNGIKPTILDKGDQLDHQIEEIVRQMRLQTPKEWSKKNRQLITKNPTITKKGIPKKLLFGSDYLYGKPTEDSPIIGKGAAPPFSYAQGGLSVGWGGAILPADDCDLLDWPISHSDLAPFYDAVMSDLPLSAVDDDLSQNFPLHTTHSSPLRLSSGNQKLLSLLQKKIPLEKDNLLVGQARLLTRVNSLGGDSGCQYCGECMSGCVYGCIYKASQDLHKLCESGSVEYIRGAHVQTLKQGKDSIKIKFLLEGNSEQIESQKILLAAGALNSSRIVMESIGIFDQKIEMKVRAGFVIPALSFRHLPNDISKENTQPGLFLEFKSKSISNHWVHTQLSTPNEFVYKRMKADLESRGLAAFVKRKALSHSIVAFCNMHSKHADSYHIWLKEGTNGKAAQLHYQREENEVTQKAITEVQRNLKSILRRINFYTLPFMSQTNSGSYHVGATLPMTINSDNPLTSDINGEIRGLPGVFTIDTAAFPSLPGTTLGLLAMANAARIARFVASQGE
jgi:choline dehydrogenase-like flavoprotein